MKKKILFGALLMLLAGGVTATVVFPPSFMQTQKSYH